MNLSGFDVPENGRWALNPAENSPADRLFDIDNDSLLNTQEVPDRWDTNPVNDDSDGDRLPDGWETAATERALNEGLVDNMSLELIGARGPLDPRMPDSDLDGILDGDEDFDNDGLNRTGMMNRYWFDIFPNDFKNYFRKADEFNKKGLILLQCGSIPSI